MLAANYRTKKELKAAVGRTLAYTETAWSGPEYRPDGTFPVVGPSAYERKWYAEVTLKDGKIVKVK